MQLPLDRLQLNTMASGELALGITKKVSWDEFPRFANKLLALIQGTLLERADTPVERVWSVQVQGRNFWLSLDDWTGISLEPQDPAAGELIQGIREELMKAAAQ